MRACVRACTRSDAVHGRYTRRQRLDERDGLCTREGMYRERGILCRAVVGSRVNRGDTSLRPRGLERRTDGGGEILMRDVNGLRGTKL